MIDNIEKAIMLACKLENCSVNEYTVFADGPDEFNRFFIIGLLNLLKT